MTRHDDRDRALHAGLLTHAGQLMEVDAAPVIAVPHRTPPRREANGNRGLLAALRRQRTVRAWSAWTGSTR